MSNGHVFTQTFQFEPPANLDEYGLVAVTCAIAGGVLSCQWGPLDVFYLAPSDVVNGTQTGETVLFGETGDGTPFTIKIVPT